MSRPTRIAILAGPLQRNDAISEVVQALLNTLTISFVHPATEVRVICPYSEFFRPEILVAPSCPSTAEQFLERCDAVIVSFGFVNDIFDGLRFAARAAKILLYFGLTPVDYMPRTQAQEIVASVRQLDRLGPFDGVVVTSNYLFSQLVGIRSIKAWARCEKIGLPLRQEFFSELPDDPKKRRSGRWAARRRILCCGRLVELKGVDRLLRAFSGSQARIRGWKIVFAGAKAHSNARFIDKLVNLARDMGCSSQAGFAFDLRTDDLVQLFDTCGLYATASMHEGFGYPLVEALSRGVPVVCGADSAMAETVGGMALHFQSLDIADLTSGLDAAIDLIEAGKFLAGGKPLAFATWQEKAIAYARDCFSDGCFAPLLKLLSDILDDQFASAPYHGYLASAPWTHQSPISAKYLSERLREDLLEGMTCRAEISPHEFVSWGDGQPPLPAGDIVAAVERAVNDNDGKRLLATYPERLRRALTTVDNRNGDLSVSCSTQVSAFERFKRDPRKVLGHISTVLGYTSRHAQLLCSKVRRVMIGLGSLRVYLRTCQSTYGHRTQSCVKSPAASLRSQRRYRGNTRPGPRRMKRYIFC